MQQYTTLISVDQLTSLMKSKDGHDVLDHDVLDHDALGHDSFHASLIIFDCRFSLTDTEQGRDKYKTSHIPTALYVHLNHDLAGAITPHSGRHPLPKVEHFIHQVRAWGINDHTQIVVYDDAAGAIAARLWWMMKWIGYTRVAVLDGGYTAWQNSGLPTSDHLETPTNQLQHTSKKSSNKAQKLSTKRNKNSPENSPETNIKNSLIEVDELIKLLKSNRVNLYDARAEPRFAGKHEPIDAVAGHIPGAINLPFEQNLDEHGFFLPADTLKRRFRLLLNENPNEKSNEKSETQIVHMCGSGVTACHNILAMEIAAIAPTRLYVGSWSEWINDTDRAVAISENPKH